MGLASTKSFLPVTRELLSGPPQEKALDLFARAGIAKSPGYRVLRFYEVHDAVRTHRGSIERDARRILTLQGGLRADRAAPDRALPKGPPLADAVKALQDLGVRHAIGFQTAANLLAYFEPSGPHALYVHRADAAPARQAREALDALVNSPRASGKDSYEIHLADLDRLDVRTGPNGPITSPVQTLLDLALHTRTAAHKEFFFDFLGKQGAIHG